MVLQISSPRATASIDPERGARLASLVVDGTELIGRAKHIGVGPLDWFDGSFPMAPFPGNVRDGSFRFNGERYFLPPNNGPHAAHGLVDAANWSVREKTYTRADLDISLCEPWPFGGLVSQRFEISDHHLEVTMTCSNEVREMPAALGFHPWFRRDLGDGPAELEFAPKSRFQPVAPGLFGDQDADLGTRPWDDAFALVGTPKLRWPAGQRITVISDAPVWMLYEQHPDGICIEPLTAAPDSLEAGRATIVGPGRALTLTMRLDWT